MKAKTRTPKPVRVIHTGPTLAARVQTWQIAHAPVPVNGVSVPDETYLLVTDLWAALLDPRGAHTDRRGLPK